MLQTIVLKKYSRFSSLLLKVHTAVLSYFFIFSNNFVSNVIFQTLCALT